MDLTVEIHGDAVSLEECLDQFTAREWLHGDNMYKCDRYFIKSKKPLESLSWSFENSTMFLKPMFLSSPGVVTM